MTMPRSTRPISRRTAVASLGISGAALAAARLGASAQDTESDAMANHPMVGIWLAITPDGPAPTHVLADGSFLAFTPQIAADAETGETTIRSPQVGTWEPDDDRGIHFTTVQSIRDMTGTNLGTLTVDGYPAASEDGESFYDDGTRVRLTFRDTTNTVTMVIGEDGSAPPVFGNRMRPGEPSFADATPEAATPMS